MKRTGMVKRRTYRAGLSVCLMNPDYLERWDLDRIHNLVVWLEGIKLGSGGKLDPLGTATIDSLWKAIRTLNGILVMHPECNPKGTLDGKKENTP
jgi:hypothetical protein